MNNMEKVIAIKNKMIEIKRKINYIINHKADEVKMNVFTGYKSERAIELDGYLKEHCALINDLKAACLNDNLIYSSIVNAADKEAEIEEVKVNTKLLLTVADLERPKKKVITVKPVIKPAAKPVEPAKEVKIEVKEEVKVEEPAKEVESIKKVAAEEEFWNLVNEATTDNKMDLGKEVYGDLEALYNIKTSYTEDEKEIKEDEYIDISKLTYDSAEIWKTIKGTDYQVSTKGNIRIASTKEKVDKVMTENNMMAVNINNAWYNLSGLIYCMFIEKGSTKVRHIDNDTKNNHILNLKAA